MAEPDNDPNAEQGLEADAHQVNPTFSESHPVGEMPPPALPLPLPYQPPGRVFPVSHPPIHRNVDTPKQIPVPELAKEELDANTADPNSPPTTGPTPTALP